MPMNDYMNLLIEIVHIYYTKSNKTMRVAYILSIMYPLVGLYVAGAMNRMLLFSNFN